MYYLLKYYSHKGGQRVGFPVIQIQYKWSHWQHFLPINGQVYPVFHVVISLWYLIKNLNCSLRVNEMTISTIIQCINRNVSACNMIQSILSEIASSFSRIPLKIASSISGGLLSYEHTVIEWWLLRARIDGRG